MRKSTHTPEYAELRAILAQARGDAGFSQRELAGRLQVPHSWVAKVESGERRIDVVELIWFCEACHSDASAALISVAQAVAAISKPAAGKPRKPKSRRGTSRGRA